MPREYSMGARVARGAAQPGGRGEPPVKQSLRERFAALRNLPPFLKSIWQTSRLLSVSSIVLRLLRALLPVATSAGMVRLASAGADRQMMPPPSTRAPGASLS